MKWKDLKGRWNRLFQEEEPEYSSRELRKEALDGSKSVEARVAYLYPKRSLATPQRESVNNRYSRNDDKHIDDKSVHTTSASERKPFKPSEIPSPVHGFNNRRSRQEKKEEKLLQPRRTLERRRTLKEQDVVHAKKHDGTDSIAAVQDNKEQKLQLSPKQPEADFVQEEKQRESRISLGVTKPVVHRPSIEENETIRNEEKQIPLNVMMTPRDKYLMRRKERETQIEKKERKESEQNSSSTQVTQSVPLHLLEDEPFSNQKQSNWIQEQTKILQQTFDQFRINAKVIDAKQGPTVTRFEIQPAPGVKVSKIKSLTDDIKLNLAAKDIRMEAPIPGKHAIGIEIPNEHQEPVFLHRLIQSTEYQSSTSPLTVALGADIEGKPVVTDLMRMPHGLIAGATGSGKSVCINTMLISLLYKASHEDVKFLMIDPKMVELAPYNGIPHLVSPVITDVKAATYALKWAVQEMESRYEAFVEEEVRDITRFNEKMIKQGINEKKMPYIVIVIDELADLMMSAPQDVEDAICRIAQKARACGIHLLIATQRPSVDVITGLIKANVPTRIAFSVSSQVDSRTILDTNGAEKLLGRGDMLFVENGSRHMSRIQGAFVSDQEIERITNHVRKMAEPEYLLEPDQWVKQVEIDEEIDELYEEAVEFVMEHNSASVSLLQRRFRIGYNRAARLIDAMEREGIISGQNGSKPREVLVTKQ